MLLKDLLLITFGGGGFLGLMGTSGYFVYRQETIKSVERDISATLGEINEEVQKLIGKRVNDKGEIVTIDSNGNTISDETLEASKKENNTNTENTQRKKHIDEIQNLIKKAEDKNKNWWSLYVSGIEDILNRYSGIVESESNAKPWEKILTPKPKVPKAPKPAAARPVATKTEATKTATVRPAVAAKPVAPKP